MWRLRNRLIVTYVFIGVIPIILLVAMALLAGYLFAGQFATYVAMSDLAVGAAAPASRRTARSPHSSAALAADGKLTPATGGRDRQRLGRELSPSHRDGLGRRQGLRAVEPGGPSHGTDPGALPDTAKGDFSGFVLDSNRLHLRAVKHVDEGDASADGNLQSCRSLPSCCAGTAQNWAQLISIHPS